MKKICILLFIILFKNASSQIVVQDFKSKEMQKFLASKTMFVLFGKKDFDDALKAAVTKYWKITPFAFINENEVDSKIADESLSFLTNVDYVTVTNPGGFASGDLTKGLNKGTVTKYSIICGGRKSLDKYKYEQKNEIAYFNGEITGVNLTGTQVYKNQEDKNSTGGGRLDIKTLDFEIKCMNDGLEAVSKNKITGGDDKVRDAVFETYSSKAPVLKKKTLLIDKNNTIDRGPHIGVAIDVNALKSHGIKYEIKTSKEISDLIESSDPNYCFFNQAMAMGFFSYVFDLETKETVYAAFDLRNPSFDKNAIEKLGNKMNGRK